MSLVNVATQGQPSQFHGWQDPGDSTEHEPLESKRVCDQLLSENTGRVWQLTLLIPALERQRKVDLHEFEVSLVYRANSRTARAVTQRNTVSNYSSNNKNKRFKVEQGFLGSSKLA